MRRGPLWAIALLVVQVAIPSWQLTRTRPARFGWQMYAGGPPAAEFVAVGRDGSTARVVVGDYVVRLRDDLDLVRFLPPAICARTEAVAVRYRDARSQQPVELPCRR